MIIRAIFDRGAAVASDNLQDRVPPGISTTTVTYDPDDAQGVLDIYRGPDAVSDMPLLVWIHGGGFVSGRRADVANYLKILAGRGITVVNVEYTIAPESTYPTPVRQLVTALAYVIDAQEPLGLDASRIVLAGDSAGAQIAAQTAAILANPEYAERVGIRPDVAQGQIAGTLLFCGVYDIRAMGQDGGVLGWFVQTAGWAYSGTRDWRASEEFASIEFLPHLTAAFPPTFISAGNADPLAQQSVALAEALEDRGVAVERLFFPPEYQPALGHEYQFDLTTEAGELALEHAVDWLSRL